MTSHSTKHTLLAASPPFAQPKAGYRFTSDAVKLAEFVNINTDETLLDLCTGVGVVPLLLWKRRPFRVAVGVELQPELADLAKLNVLNHGLDGRVRILQKDVRTISPADIVDKEFALPDGHFDVVTTNPPYRRVGAGRINPNRQRALARHEISLTLAELVQSARRFSRSGTRLYLCHLADREAEVLAELEAHSFVVRRKEAFGRCLLVEAHCAGAHQSLS